MLVAEGIVLESQGERLTWLRKTVNLNQADFGKAVGLTQARLSRYERNDTALDETTAIAIEYVYHARARWLLIGEEPRMVSKELVTTKRDPRVEALERAMQTNPKVEAFVEMLLTSDNPVAGTTKIDEKRAKKKSRRR